MNKDTTVASHNKTAVGSLSMPNWSYYRMKARARVTSGLSVRRKDWVVNPWLIYRNRWVKPTDTQSLMGKSSGNTAVSRHAIDGCFNIDISGPLTQYLKQSRNSAMAQNYSHYESVAHWAFPKAPFRLPIYRRILGIFQTIGIGIYNGRLMIIYIFFIVFLFKGLWVSYLKFAFL